MITRVDKYFNYRQQLKDQWLIFNKYLNKELLNDIKKLNKINTGLTENISFPIRMPFFEFQKQVNAIDKKIGSVIIKHNLVIDDKITKIKSDFEKNPIQNGLIDKRYLLKNKDYQDWSNIVYLIGLIDKDHPKIKIPQIDIKQLKKINVIKTKTTSDRKWIKLTIPVLSISLIAIFLILVIVFAIIL